MCFNMWAGDHDRQEDQRDGQRRGAGSYRGSRVDRDLDLPGDQHRERARSLMWR